ncbi:MAG: hypothetical protein KAU94_12040 [Verrucomicrobia bacterium]|nr:hypothetical protein [Verrucomicrobiota bacterium]
MKKIWVLLTVVFAGMAMVASAATGDIVEWIVNGDFETGDLTGWNGTNDAAIINSTTPIDGSYSANVTNNWLWQEGFGIVSNTVTVNFDFSMEDPGGVDDRGLQFFVGLNKIYARVVDGPNLDDGFGDIEFYDGSAWVSVLTDVVEFGIPNALSITINGFGDDFDYDLVVNGVTNTGMSLLQIGAMNSLDYVGFRGIASAVRSGLENLDQRLS